MLEWMDHLSIVYPSSERERNRNTVLCYPSIVRTNSISHSALRAEHIELQGPAWENVLLSS